MTDESKLTLGTYAGKLPAAFTLLEVVVSLTAASVLMAGLCASVLIGARTADTTRPAYSRLQAAQAVTTLGGELEYAVHLVHWDERTIEFVVADRDGDDQRDTIRYAWSGTPGDPLTRQFNRGSLQVIVPDVQQFALQLGTRDRNEQVTRLVSSEEQLLAGNTSLNQIGWLDIHPTLWAGQSLPADQVTASLPPEALSWFATRLEFIAMGVLPIEGGMSVELRSAAGDGKPTSEVLSQVFVPESELSALLFQWETVGFAQPVRDCLPQEGICVVYRTSSGDVVARVVNDDAGGGGALISKDAGATWQVDAARRNAFQLFGKYRYEQQLTFLRRYAIFTQFSLQIGEQMPPLHAAVQFGNSPELLSGYWELDFAADPTAVDVNGDGQTDWRSASTSPPAAAAHGGTWTTEGEAWLETVPAQPWQGLTTVHLRLRDQVADSAGAVFWINGVMDFSLAAPIRAEVLRQSDGTQAARLQVQNADGWQTLTTVAGLTSQFVDLRMVLDPELAIVHFQVNGVNAGTYDFEPLSLSDEPRAARFGSDAAGAEFDYVSIRAGAANLLQTGVTP